MERLFGTDGVRGIPGQPPLVPDTVRGLAFEAAKLLLARAGRRANGDAPLILLGRDTRGSGPRLYKSLVEGFAAAGCRAMDLGVVPTPAVSYLTPRVGGAVGGVVVSASHNPAHFNGIKFFDADGFKMDPAAELRIEKELADKRRPSARLRRARGLPSRLRRLALGGRLRRFLEKHVSADDGSERDEAGHRLRQRGGLSHRAGAFQELGSRGLRARLLAERTQYQFGIRRP